MQLNGQWAFYWGRFLNPSIYGTPHGPTPDRFIPIPGVWNGRVAAGTTLQGTGFATYHLIIRTGTPISQLALKIQDVGTAYKLFIDDLEIAACGKIAYTRESARPGSQPDAIYLDEADTVLNRSDPDSRYPVIESPTTYNLYLHISNFHHRMGGLWEPIYLGTKQQIRTLHQSRFYLAMFLLGSIFIMGIYHFGLFILRLQYRATLYFGIFCLLTAIRLMVTGERGLLWFFPDLNWTLLLKFEYLSFYLAVPTFTLYVYALFADEFHKPLIRAILVTSALCATFVIATPVRIFSHGLLYFQIVTISAFIYGTFVIIRALQRKREGAVSFLIGFSLIFITVVNDILYSRQIVHTGYYFPWGLFFFIFSQAFLISARFSKAFTTVEAQRVRLSQTNRSLAREISERRSAESALMVRLGYEKMLFDISSKATAAKDIDDFQYQCIKRMGEHLSLSRVYIFKFTAVTERIERSYVWVDSDDIPARNNADFPICGLPSWIRHLKKRGIVNIDSIDNVFCRRVQLTLKQHALKSMLILPLFVGNRLYGLIGFDDCQRTRIWGDEDLDVLNTIAQIIARAITDKRRELELKDSERKYRSLFEESLEAMSITRGGVIVDVNPAWLSLHDFHEITDVVGHPIWEFIYPADHNIVRERRRLWPDVSSRAYQIRDVRRDGSTVEVEVYSSAISYGAQDAILATIHDIGAVKQEAIATEQLKARLQRAEKMELIGTLAGGVAHDLNNLLSGLVSYPELLLMDIPPASSLAGPLLTIQKSGQKAAAIVQDLLTLTRRGVVTNEVVDLNLLIKELLDSPELHRLKSFHPLLAIETDLLADLLPILGSPVHLSKSVLNLISNAAEAMPEGGNIRITTQNYYADKPQGGLVGIDKGEFIQLTVADNGTGIAPEDRERIFEPFYTKKKMGRSGTGLGMAVVWGTVQDHNGHIEIESTSSTGTTFVLYFPVTRQKAEIVPETFELASIRGQGEFILVVDDVAEQRELAVALLRKLGYTADAVAGGEEAAKLVARRRVDLVVLDMIMEPNIGGLETYRRIKEYVPGQKAIIASGYSETKDVREALRLGVIEYVKKPYTLRKIGSTVRMALDHDPPRDSLQSPPAVLDHRHLTSNPHPIGQSHEHGESPSPEKHLSHGLNPVTDRQNTPRSTPGVRDTNPVALDPVSDPTPNPRQPRWPAPPLPAGDEE